MRGAMDTSTADALVHCVREFDPAGKGVVTLRQFKAILEQFCSAEQANLLLEISGACDVRYRDFFGWLWGDKTSAAEALKVEGLPQTSMCKATESLLAHTEITPTSPKATTLLDISAEIQTQNASSLLSRLDAICAEVLPDVFMVNGAGEGQEKWAGVCAADDGRLFCAPWNSDKVLVITPATHSLSFMDGAGAGDCKWSGICKGADGRLFCAPHDDDRVLIINPCAGNLSFIDGIGTGKAKWDGICTAADGRLFCAPHCSREVLIIDPHTMTTETMKPVDIGDFSYSGICAADDG